MGIAIILVLRVSIVLVEWANTLKHNIIMLFRPSLTGLSTSLDKFSCIRGVSSVCRMGYWNEYYWDEMSYSEA